MRFNGLNTSALVLLAFVLTAFSSAQADPCESIGEVCEPATQSEIESKRWLPALRTKMVGTTHDTYIRLYNPLSKKVKGGGLYGNWRSVGNDKFERSVEDSCHQYKTSLFYRMQLTELIEVVDNGVGGKAFKVSRSAKPFSIPSQLDFATTGKRNSACLDYSSIQLHYDKEIKDFDQEAYTWAGTFPVTAGMSIPLNYMSAVPEDFEMGGDLHFKVQRKKSKTKIKKSWTDFIRGKMSEVTVDGEATNLSAVSHMDAFMQPSSAKYSSVYINIEKNKLFIFPKYGASEDFYEMRLPGVSYPARDQVRFSRDHYQEAEIMLNYLSVLKARMQYRVYEPTYGVMEEALRRVVALRGEGRSVLSSKLAQEMMAIILLRDHVIDGDLAEDLAVGNRAKIVSRLIQRIDNIKKHYTRDDVANVGTYFAATVAGSVRRTTDEMIKEMRRDEDQAEVRTAMSGLEQINILAESIEVAESWGDGDVENSRVLDELLSTAVVVMGKYESVYSQYDDDQGLSEKLERGLNVLSQLRRGQNYSVLNLGQSN